MHHGASPNQRSCRTSRDFMKHHPKIILIIIRHVHPQGRQKYSLVKIMNYKNILFENEGEVTNNN